MMKNILLGLGLALVLSTAGWSQATLKIGATAGPHEQILEEVKKLLAKDGVNLDIVVFTDYILPNLALDQKDLDVNSYQHQPFLDRFNADRKTNLVSVATTVNFPIGVYSKKIKDLSQLKDGDQIGIPNDPTNGGRALLVLESAGVFKLKPGLGVKATVNDIVVNPKHLQIVELEASQTPHHLDELAAAVINTNFAQTAGLSITKDAIFRESPQSPYVNVIAVRKGDEDKPLIKKLVAAYRSEAIKKFIADKFQGSVLASW
jgi:D-methionine transport system substrate-binding protein